MIKSIKLNPFVITALSIIIGILAYYFGVPFIDLVELKTVDLRFQTRGKISPRPEVVLAVIDEKSLAREGKWIWPRSKIADLINKLSKAGARVIAFDIGFLEPDDKIVLQTIDQIKQKIQHLKIQNSDIEAYLENLKRQTDNDRLLADAIKNSRAKVVLGYFFQMDSKGTGYLSPEALRLHEENVKGSQYKFVRYKSNYAQNVPLIEAMAPQSNIKTIESCI